MRQIEIGPWTINVDLEKTKEFYAKHHFITEDCTCDYCANYVLACLNFSKELQELFSLLGIDPQKEGEAMEYRRNEDGTHLYGVFYHVVGNIMDGPASREFIGFHEAEISFSEELELVPEEFPAPVFQFDIQLNVPWKLT